MPPTTTNEKSTYSTSAPGKSSSPTSPSVFVNPERTSRSGVSSPRYDRQKRNSSSSTSSWVSQEESPPRYGEQKTPESAYTSAWFSEEDSINSPFSPSCGEYHVDSATLFGAPGKSTLTSPSVFVFPEKTPRSGVSPPRYGREKRNSSSSTSSWVSQEESPPRYGEQKTPESANTSSWFSEEDSNYSPFSPSFEYHIDSATLFGEQSPPSGRKISASPVSPSEKHHMYFSEAQASTSTWTPPTFSAPTPESDKRKSRYSLSKVSIKDIIPPSSSGTPISRGIDSRGVSYLQPSYLDDPPSKSAPEKKHRKLSFSALRRKPKTIKKLCCNLAEEFSNRVPATRVRQKYSGKQPPDIRKQPLRTLAASTFNSFVSQPDLVGVMFYHSTTNKPGTLEDWTTHSKSNLGANQLFASVDCAKESSLCAREGISSLPFYKLYSSGSTVKVAKDLKNL